MIYLLTSLLCYRSFQSCLLLLFLGCCVLTPRCLAGGVKEEGFVSETLSDVGSVVTSPLRAGRTDLYWLGGLAAGGLLAYSADGQVRHGFSRNHSQLNEDLTSVFEKLGNGGYALGIVGLYGGISHVTGCERGERTAVLAFQSFAAANAAGTLLKYSAGRARPYVGDGKRRFKPFGFKSSRTSFPSGHTTTAFSLASVFVRRYSSPAFGIFAYSMAAGTSLQRVYMEKHWFSDVFAGAVLGTVVGRWIASPEREGKKTSAMLFPVYEPGYSGAAAVFSF